jgi:hypothetical protein
MYRKKQNGKTRKRIFLSVVRSRSEAMAASIALPPRRVICLLPQRYRAPTLAFVAYGRK